MTAYYYWISFSLLSFALYNFVDGCVPVNTSWTGMCKAECSSDNHREVTLSICNQTTLLSGSYSGGNDVQVFYFVDAGITHVSRRAFSGYAVYELELRDSFVTFEPGCFEGLSVSWLYIDHNPNLTSLPSGVFRGVTGLEDLYLYYNNLQSLPADIFHGLTSLRWLYLNDNNLQSLPRDIFTGLERLKYLHVHGNSISCFAHDLFQPLHSLQELEMSQTVDIEGLCPQTFKGIGPSVLDYNVEIEKCVVECSFDVGGLKVIDSNQTCNCFSYEGCLNCTAPTMTDMTSSAGSSTRRSTEDKSGVWKQHGIILVALLILSYSI